MSKDKILTREECLNLDMESEWKTHKITNNLYGDLSICRHCKRKYVICCICDDGIKRWGRTIEEVRAVQDRNRNLD